MMAALRAKKSGPGYTPDNCLRPKPRFRLIVPGLPTVIGANLLLVYVCMRMKI